MVLYENYNSNRARKRLTLGSEKEEEKSFIILPKVYGRNHVIMECCIAAIDNVSIYQPKNVAETTVN